MLKKDEVAVETTPTIAVFRLQRRKAVFVRRST